MDEGAGGATARARVTTANGSRYLQQLCKHWSHRFAVEFDPSAGTIGLTGAVLRLAADAEGLTLDLEAEDAATRERLMPVVAEHLRRFAFREDFSVDWGVG